MRVSITPSPNPDGRNWCHNCREPNNLFSLAGFRNYGGWTLFCRTCLEDLGVTVSEPANGHVRPAAPVPETPAPPAAFDGTYPMPEGRTAGVVMPPPPEMKREFGE